MVSEWPCFRCVTMSDSLVYSFLTPSHRIHFQRLLWISISCLIHSYRVRNKSTLQSSNVQTYGCRSEKTCLLSYISIKQVVHVYLLTSIPVGYRTVGLYGSTDIRSATRSLNGSRQGSCPVSQEFGAPWLDPDRNH